MSTMYLHFCDDLCHFARMAMFSTSSARFYLGWVATVRRNSGINAMILDADHCILVL